MHLRTHAIMKKLRVGSSLLYGMKVWGGSKQTKAWETNKKIQKTHKSKILFLGWMQDMEKWFGRWDATRLLHDASLDSSVNEAFLQRQCIMT